MGSGDIDTRGDWEEAGPWWWCDGLSVWKVSGNPRWLHIVSYDGWTVLPSSVCTPWQSRTWFPTKPPGVYIAQTAVPVPLLKFAFAEGVQLTLDELKELADIIGVDLVGHRSSKSSVLRCIATFVAAGDGLVAAT